MLRAGQATGLSPIPVRKGLRQCAVQARPLDQQHRLAHSRRGAV